MVSGLFGLCDLSLFSQSFVSICEVSKPTVKAVGIVAHSQPLTICKGLCLAVSQPAMSICCAKEGIVGSKMDA